MQENETPMTSSIESVLVLSGGMDSTVLLYDLMAKKRQTAAISFDYGSRHNHRELPMAAATCEKLGVIHRIIRLPFIGELFSSALLKTGPPIPEGSYDTANLSQTVVPFRNPILMSIAVGYAASIGAKEVLLASHSGDHALYPDCRKTFNEAFDQAVRLGTDNAVHLSFPYAGLDKGQIAEIGRRLGVDFTLTWTCYKGGNRHCGRCSACVERSQALKRSEGLDPTLYEDQGEHHGR
ncbi:7-cyano-7-deazaguanine synthase QueC [Desulfobotulus sp. H1]|uniref:7-cyano-7-deazaguanine synthase n=1 Tax=Desulfobotulus pelophilus TaxID=2823377 RepID=A0ABT3N7R2_9BACT|nr:7-cyano-7-deazaguanine synthase QueC [Desulfobotulus pelophilus]MCW7753507.1 7-cyano-7-deazaguanine synthase QueC [Desulfobotulus pelophilus]